MAAGRGESAAARGPGEAPAAGLGSGEATAGAAGGTAAVAVWD